MGEFSFYFKLGWGHIISREAADHLLFITALSAIYLFNNFRQVLILVTAFTIGHCLTLLLSAYDVIRFPVKWVEFFIPVTIAFTAVFNLVQQDVHSKWLRWNYLLALVFGLIHGLGFANTIRFLLAKGQQIGVPLFGFNAGIEAGQIAVVFLLLLCSFLFVNLLHFPRKWWVWILSVSTGLIALYIAFNRWPL